MYKLKSILPGFFKNLITILLVLIIFSGINRMVASQILVEEVSFQYSTMPEKIKSRSLKSAAFRLTPEVTEELIQTYSDKFELTTFYFSSFLVDMNSGFIANAAEDEFYSIDPAIIGKILCYPNPFRLSDPEGTTVGYRLSKNMDVKIYIYDMLGHRIFEQSYLAGMPGGRGGDDYNKLKFTVDDLEYFYFSAGVYILVLTHEGKVLGKTKMAVIP